MKKIAIVVVICFITAIFVSSCSEKSCPAYTKAETEHTGDNG